MLTIEGYKKLINHLKSSPIILWAIPSDEFLHPCATDISIVFIKDINDKNIYCLSFNHSDASLTIDKKTFVDDLNNLDGIKWVFDKKSFIQLLPFTKDLLDINLFNHLQKGKLIDKQYFETQAHKFIYQTKKNCGDLNKVVPLLKHKEMFEKMCDKSILLDINLIDEGYRKENEIVIETLSELESNGIYVNANCFGKHFNAKIQPNGLVYSQYNVYTSTGRPSNHFDGVNYAALSKDSGVRKCFISRYGNDGMMILIDYSAFHPRIICNIVNFPMGANEDIYKYLGEIYFNRKITEYDLEEIKRITMRQLYGGVEEKYEHIKYFRSLKEFIDDNWKCFRENGYVTTPIFRRMITTDHLKDANPAKLFNYILQATETEIALTAINCVNKYLRDKKTKAILYTYDSLLFDFYKADGTVVLNDIINIMMMCNRFPIKVYKGESYDSVIQIYP
jgi:DNA polymerase I-like protein with 3'-5' exonuclease and polymerase domains